MALPLILLAATQAMAAPPPQSLPYKPAAATIMAEPVAMMLAGFDADGDGRVTRAEMTAGVARSFAAIDTAQAGTLGYIAFADWAERWLGDRNAVPSPFEADRDGDGKVTLAELQTRLAAIFDRLDANHDGTLSHAELLTIRGAPPRTGGDDDGARRGRRRAPRDR